MNILLVTSEVFPFSKTGGLADVCGALPRELAKTGQQVSVITPAYRCVKRSAHAVEETGVALEIPIGSRTVNGRILRGRLPESDVPVYFVEQDDYYDRDYLYQEDGQDYRDNCERFVFFCRAVMEAIRLLDLNVDVLHCNDWQTGLTPAYLAIEYAGVPGYEEIATVFTIHNLAYQGRFWHWDMLLTGVDWKYFNWHQMEFYGDLNLMKTGIVFADWITTVSPRYAEEIQTPPLGCGLEGTLAERRDRLTGILNGVDYAVWNPARDPHLPATYDADSWRVGKPRCKAALQQELGLPENDQAPLAGFIGRLDSQKGLDLIRAVIEQQVDHDAMQYVLLGSGHPEYEGFLRQMADEYPNKIAVRLEFSSALAHRIEAGCDMFLMPSRYEPCGLNQLYSLKYGTAPIVRRTGGLADTIVDCNPQTLNEGTANGFSFDEYNSEALRQTIARAVETYRDAPTWERLIDVGMRQDWSWSRSAARYAQLYSQAAAHKRQEAHI